MRFIQSQFWIHSAQSPSKSPSISAFRKQPESSFLSPSSYCVHIRLVSFKGNSFNGQTFELPFSISIKLYTQFTAHLLDMAFADVRPEFVSFWKDYINDESFSGMFFDTLSFYVAVAAAVPLRLNGSTVSLWHCYWTTCLLCQWVVPNNNTKLDICFSHYFPTSICSFGRSIDMCVSHVDGVGGDLSQTRMEKRTDFKNCHVQLVVNLKCLTLH